MLNVDIPGRTPLHIRHLVLDYNGTVAFDGRLKAGVAERLEKLSASVAVHVLTADTYGSVHAQCDPAFMRVHVIGKEAQDEQKLRFLQSLDPAACVAVGNGMNDALMLEAAALGIAVVQEEGISVRTLQSADVLFKSIADALDALLIPNRLVATLRN